MLGNRFMYQRRKKVQLGTEPMPIEKIIVLEDEPVVRKNLEQFLRGRGYDVAPASTLAAARGYLTKDNFDLVISDQRLPHAEGTELLRHLHARPQRPLMRMR